MSSLLQFGGRTADGKVGLLFQVVEKREHEVAGLDYTVKQTHNTETFHCADCGKEHIRIHEAFRKPAGMFGCWVVFRYCGEEHAPDLSIPINIEKLPRDARALSDAECCKYWNS